MPAMLEDPSAPPIYRTSGPPPYPIANNPCIPDSITPRLVTLRDRITTASLLPISTAAEVPLTLLAYLCAQFNLEIEKGDTYPMTVPLSLEEFGSYWFQSFGAIMLLGEVKGKDELWVLEQKGDFWESVCLGTFYIKPNYPGRSSHVCNGGFIVTDAARNRGVGRLMGEGYLEWAPKLNYTYSVFNLVYETNVASIRIWDALGFKRIGRVKGCGNLRSSPDALVDAIIYGRDLGPEGEDFVSEERFDKIRFYLKHGKYPNGADRAEKSRLRSAATHYKLLPAEDDDDPTVDKDNERLMLKDKEVVSDPQRQYEIARRVHAAQHGGINKTTATIAEKHHWVRIKETVSLVIKNCPDCKDASKVPTVRPVGENLSSLSSATGGTRRSNGQSSDPNSMIERLVNFDDLETSSEGSAVGGTARGVGGKAGPMISRGASSDGTTPGQVPVAQMHSLQTYADIPLDPQIMQHQPQNHQHHHHHHLHPHPTGVLHGHGPRISPTGYHQGTASTGHDDDAEDGHFELDLSPSNTLDPQQQQQPNMLHQPHGQLHDSHLLRRTDNSRSMGMKAERQHAGVVRQDDDDDDDDDDDNDDEPMAFGSMDDGFTHNNDEREAARRFGGGGWGVGEAKIGPGELGV